MNSSLALRHIEKIGRLIVPYGLLCLLMIISLINLHFPYIGSVKPYLVLMAVYYWSIYRPTLIPAMSCFIMGIILDVLSGVPLGLNAFIFVGTQWVVRDQRRFLMGQPYVTIWAVFGLVALVCGLWQWGAFGLMSMKWPSAESGVFAIVLSLLLFPFVTLLLNLTHRVLPAVSRP